jgi:hypothetical protein
VVARAGAPPKNVSAADKSSSFLIMRAMVSGLVGFGMWLMSGNWMIGWGGGSARGGCGCGMGGRGNCCGLGG